MQVLKAVALLIIAFVSAGTGAEPLPRVEEFSNLKQGDVLIALFHTRGCFHDQTFELTFNQQAELVVAIVQLRRHENVVLGTLTLAKSDIQGLDREMQAYRSKQEGGCTTVNEITFSHRRNGKTLAVEKIKDASCATWGLKNFTTLSKLVERVTIR